MKRLIPGALLMLLVACGGGGSPSAPTPTIAQVAGVWGGSTTLTNVSGGECVGAFYAARISARSAFTIAIQQSGNNLTATETDVATGGTCSYTGSVGASTITLNAQRCDLGVFTRFVCANGALRDFQIQTSGFTGTVSGNTIAGTASDTYNVFVSGTNIAVGVMAFNASVAATKQ